MAVKDVIDVAGCATAPALSPRDRLDAADGVLAVDYLDAQRVRGQLAEGLLRCSGRAAVLAMPTTATTAPLVTDAGRHLMGLARNAIPWSFAKFPAISVPAGQVDGLPVGTSSLPRRIGRNLLIAAGLAVQCAVSTISTPAASG